jgi:FixJ family two-component response regulator
MVPDHIVFIVDDDQRIRESLTELLSSFDLHAVALGSAAEYLAYPKPDVPACLILDVELPDINGLELQSRMTEGHHPHIVFISGHGDIPSTVRAIKAGAVDFLAKPFKESDPEAHRRATVRDRVPRCRGGSARLHLRVIDSGGAFAFPGSHEYRFPVRQPSEMSRSPRSDGVADREE